MDRFLYCISPRRAESGEWAPTICYTGGLEDGFSGLSAKGQLRRATQGQHCLGKHLTGSAAVEQAGPPVFTSGVCPVALPDCLTTHPSFHSKFSEASLPRMAFSKPPTTSLFPPSTTASLSPATLGDKFKLNMYGLQDSGTKAPSFLYCYFYNVCKNMNECLSMSGG